MYLLEAILASMCFTALAEVGDKTMFATMAIAMKYDFTTAILASAIAFAISSIAVALGAHYVAQAIPLAAINMISALLFIAVGILILREALKAPEELQRAQAKDVKFLALLASMIIAELGDKTQVGVFTLTLIHGFAATVIGAVLGYLAVNVASSMISHMVGKAIDWRSAMILSAAIFMAMGAAMLLTAAL